MMVANSEHSVNPKLERMFRIMLLSLGGFALFSVVGYATFGLHPQWLNAFPPAISKYLNEFYRISFRLFGEGQTWFMALGLLAYLTGHVKGRWVPAALAVVVLSFASEWAGTVYGFPFGAYTYSDTLMGYRLLGHVPTVIPMSWFMMAVPSFAIAYAAYPESRVKVVLTGALLLTLWDVSLDPAMSYLVPYWSWKVKGAFYGMPLQNWFGWYVTGLVLMAAMSALRSERWVANLSLPWLGAFYAINWFVPFGMLVAAGLWWGVLVSLLCVAVCLIGLMPPSLRLHLWSSSSSGPSPSPTPGVVDKQLP